MFDIHRVELDWGGRKLTLETGKVARQADGAVIATYGETTVIATAVAAKQPKPGIDFLPLTVNYTEKYYAAGRIPGGYFKRERGPTEKDTLTSRLIDRPIRPLFADGWRCDTQVIITVLSHDQENDPDIVAMVAASAALTLSGAPFMGPIGGARVAFVNNEYVLNPTIDEMKESQLDLVVAGTQDAVLMVESEAKELSEEIMLGAVMFGHRHMQPVIQAIIQLAEKAAKEPRDFAQPDTKAVEKEMLGIVEADLRKAYAIPAKHRAPGRRRRGQEEGDGALLPGRQGQSRAADAAGRRRVQGARSQDRALEHPRHQQAHRRPRSRHRAPDRLRGAVPAAHPRLGAVHPRRDPGDRRRHARHRRGRAVDRRAVRAPTKKRSCCTTTSRRSRSARPDAPARPAVVRSATASSPGGRSARCCRPRTSSPTPSAWCRRSPSSNGSSSMATVCGTSLALMDAGVPLKRPTAGIAMGLILEDKRFAVLSDILGDEDHLGDMDFKVAGTEEGVTALQMDIKIAGITEEIMKVALHQAKGGRLHILGEMAKALTAARAELGEYAPRIETFKIPTDKIREVIGTGGKVIREIVEKTGAKINVEDDGTVKVASADGELIKAAVNWIKSIASDPEIGHIYEGTVVKTMDFGAFVNFFGAKDGLVHISQLAPNRVQKTTDVVKEGDKVKVKLLGLRRARQGAAVDEGRRPGDRRGPRGQAEGPSPQQAAGAE